MKRQYFTISPFAMIETYIYWRRNRDIIENIPIEYEEVLDHRPRNPIKFLSFLSSFTFLIMKFVRIYDLNVETINL